MLLTPCMSSATDLWECFVCEDSVDVVAGDAIPGHAPGGGRIVSLHAGYEHKGVYTDAFLARPAEGNSLPAVVVLSGMKGLTWTHREITRRFARAGFVALAPDYLDGQTPETLADGLLVKNSLDFGRAVDEIEGASAFLRRLPWVGSDTVGLMGFCLGGGLVLLALGKTDAFGAGVVYHQSVFLDSREFEGIDCRIQCHYGSEDPYTPREEVDAFTAALDRLGKDYEVHWYEGMGHSFAQISPEAEVPLVQHQMANESYERTFQFLKRELAEPGFGSP
jgi:carboxymethylenebutenolidase